MLSEISAGLITRVEQVGHPRGPELGLRLRLHRGHTEPKRLHRRHPGRRRRLQGLLPAQLRLLLVRGGQVCLRGALMHMLLVYPYGRVHDRVLCP